MPSDPRPGKAVLFLHVPEELRAELDELCTRNQRSLTAECIDAFRRHLASPPPPPTPAPYVAPQPRRPRGRPRKNPE